MLITAKLNRLRISPRKVRLATDLIRGLGVSEAERQLKFLTRRASEPLLKLLNSAVANAKHNFGIDKEALRIVKIVVDPGQTLKRWMPRAMGRASKILKRTCHVTLVLESSGPAVSGAKVLADKKKPLDKEERVAEETESDISILPAREIEEEKLEEPRETGKKTAVLPPKPRDARPQSKNRFFSRQTIGNVKKTFRRKAI